MTKVINRPDTTTHVLEFPFHVIRNEKEAENVRKLSEGKEIIKIGNLFHSEEFKLMMYFAIREEGKPFSEWLKYASPAELETETVTMRPENVGL